MFKLFEHRY